MNRRSRHYPIIIGGGKFKKGLIATRKKGEKGLDLYICWLNKELPSGERFEPEDIEGIEATIHFVGINMLKTTVKFLNMVLNDWKEEGNDDNHD